jgi:cell division protein FtsQ
VQSLGPGRGHAKIRRSGDALLARGIAAPRPRVPALRPTRSIVIRTPRRISLGSLRGDRARGKWLMVSVVFLAIAVGYGAWIGGQTGRLADTLATGLTQLAVAAGFGVEKITVEGQSHATDAEITAALQASPDTLMLAFDTDAAKARLEAVPWIRHAQVMRLLPSTLQVVIEERAPYAIWQHKGKTYVTDAEGVVLAPALREAYPSLPLVVGDGAAKHAKDLFAALAPFGNVTHDMIAALRVGDRRWTLKLASGLEIMLPDDNVGEALTSLEKLDAEKGVLKRDIAAVDLRLLDRITVRLHEAAPVPGAEATAQGDVPTSSTKGTASKGKT